MLSRFNTIPECDGQIDGRTTYRQDFYVSKRTIKIDRVLKL